MLMLGPILQNLDNDLLEPTIDRTFNILSKAGRLPPPPPELEGQQIKIKFISIMHQMQQATKLAGLRTLVDEVGRIGQMMPEAFDKIDVDVVVDEIARITGVRPDCVVSDDNVEAIRRQKAEEEQARIQGESMLAATEGAKNLANVEPQKLTELASAISPAAAAQGGAMSPLT
jgi:hypothetical protein